MDMKKPDKKKLGTSKNKPKLWIAISIVVVLLAAIWAVPKYIDGLKFDKIDEVQLTISNNLAIYLANDLNSSQVKKECFSVGQGPYDDGYLWCQASTISDLKRDPDPLDLGKEFLKVGKPFGEGHLAAGHDIPLYYLELKNGARCYLDIKLSSGDEVSGARRSVLYSAGADSAFAVVCGDAAKAKHYTYVE